MKKLLLGVGVLLITSCSNVMDAPVSKENFPKVIEEINSNGEYSPMKQKYLEDQLTVMVGMVELGSRINPDNKDIPSFRELVEDFSANFDSIHNSKILALENNRKLDDFLTLEDADVIPIDRFKGYLSLKLNFDHNFDKEVLYIILNYKFIDKYDTKYFDENAKLTGEVADDFRGDVEISSREEYNDVASFMYQKVPVRASRELREELGEEVADKKVRREFLMEGLQVSVTGVVFQDKSELAYQDPTWEYLEEHEKDGI